MPQIGHRSPRCHLQWHPLAAAALPIGPPAAAGTQQQQPPPQNLVDLTASDGEDEDTREPHEKEPIYSVLCNNAPFSKLEKAEIINKFRRTKPEELLARELAEKNGDVKEIFRGIDGLTEKAVQRMTAPQQAKILTQLVMFVKLSDAIHAQNGKPASRCRHPGMKKLREMMSKCATVAAAKKVAPRSKKNKRGPSQKASDGTLHQSSVVFDVEQAMKTHPCPSCGLKTLNFLESLADVEAENLLIEAANQKRLRAWQQGGSQGSKPKKKQKVAQRVACFAYQLHCGMQQTGGTCYQCKGEREAGMQMLVKPDSHGNSVCACAMCQENCAIVFTLDQYNDLAREASRARRGIVVQNGTCEWMWWHASPRLASRHQAQPNLTSCSFACRKHCW